MSESKANGGRWRPGESGNPNGRKVGTGEVALLRAGIAKHVPSIVKKLVAQAKGGDTAAARLLLERALAPVRAAEAPVSFELPEGTLTERGDAVLKAAAAGELSPGQASQLMTALAAQAKLTETDELAARIAALEARHGGA